MTIKNNIETRTLKTGQPSYRAVASYRDSSGKKQTLHGKARRQIQQAKNDLKQLRDDIAKIKKKESAKITANSLIHESYTLYYDRILRSKHEPHTVSSWQSTGRWLEKNFKSTKLRTLTRMQIKRIVETYAENHAISGDSAIAKHMIHLNKFLQFAVDEKIIADNPLPPQPLAFWFGKGLRRKQHDAELQNIKERIFWADEIKAIRKELLSIDYTQSADKTASSIGLLIQASTGIRPGELGAITPSKIRRTKDNRIKFWIDDSWDDKSKALNGRTKTGEPRMTLPLSKEATVKLEEFLQAQQERLAFWGVTDSDPLILLNTQDPRKAQQSIPITQDAVKKQLRVITDRLKINRSNLQIVPYALRHTVATELLPFFKGDFAKAAKLMGHTPETYLKTYLGVQDDELEEEADAISL